jgi:hypothetical protein
MMSPPAKTPQNASVNRRAKVVAGPYLTTVVLPSSFLLVWTREYLIVVWLAYSTA